MLLVSSARLPFLDTRGHGRLNGSVRHYIILPLFLEHVLPSKDMDLCTSVELEDSNSLLKRTRYRYADALGLHMIRGYWVRTSQLSVYAASHFLSDE